MLTRFEIVYSKTNKSLFCSKTKRAAPNGRLVLWNIYVIETSRFIHLIVKVSAIILSEYIQYRYFRLSL